MSNLNEIHENIQNQIKTIEKKINSTDRAISKIVDKINEFNLNNRSEKMGEKEERAKLDDDGEEEKEEEEEEEKEDGEKLDDEEGEKKEKNRKLRKGYQNNNNDLHIRDSEFRHNYFKFKEGALKVGGNEGSLYKDVLARLRIYIFKNKLFLQEGLIKCDEFLRVYCESETVSFFKLAAALRRVFH